jgi:hypothetical protein
MTPSVFIFAIYTNWLGDFTSLIEVGEFNLHLGLIFSNDRALEF